MIFWLFLHKVRAMLPQNLSAVLSGTYGKLFSPKNIGMFNVLWKLEIHSLGDTVASNLRQPETSTVEIIEYCCLRFHE